MLAAFSCNILARMLVVGYLISVVAAVFFTGYPVHPPDAVKRAATLAQTFKVETVEEPTAPKPPAGKQTKGKKKPPEIRSEEDLWKEEPPESGEEKAGGKKKAAVGGEEGEGEEEAGEEVEEEEATADQPQEEPIPEGPVVVGEPPPKPKEKQPPAPVSAGGVDGGSKAAGAEVAPPRPPQEEPRAASFRLPAGTPADMAATWEKRRLHLAQRDYELARQDLAEWLRLKEELDLRNMPVHALALLREAELLGRAADQEGRRALIEAAVQAAPDLAAARLARAWLWFTEAPLQIGRVADELWQAMAAAGGDPLWRKRWFANTLASALLGLGVAAAIFLLVHFLLHLRLFYHDFAHLFPRGVARLQTGILLTLLLLIPVLFRWGFVSVLLLMAAVSFLYGQVRQRVLTTVVMIFFGLVPFALGWVVSGWKVADSLAMDLAAVVRGPAEAKNLERLRARLLEKPDDRRVLAVLGLYHKRLGELDIARQLLESAQKAGGGALTANNLGNVMFLKGDVDSAIRFYDEAARQAPERPEPYFNLSRAYSAKLDLDKAKQLRDTAMRLDEDRVRRFRQRLETGLSRDAVVDMDLPADWLLAADGEADNEVFQRATTQLWWRFGGLWQPGRFPFLDGALLIVLILVAASQRLRFSQLCPHCGRPVCRVCEPGLPNLSSCGQCYNVFHRQEAVDARIRIAKEIQVRKYQRRLQRVAQFLTFLAPGSGQMLKESTLRGALMLFVFCLAAVGLLLPEDPMADPYGLSAGFFWLKKIPLIVVGLAVWVWAIVDIFRQRAP